MKALARRHWIGKVVHDSRHDLQIYCSMTLSVTPMISSTRRIEALLRRGRSGNVSCWRLCHVLIYRFFTTFLVMLMQTLGLGWQAWSKRS